MATRERRAIDVTLKCLTFFGDRYSVTIMATTRTEGAHLTHNGR